MKATISDLLVSYLLKGGVLWESKGEVETKIDIPMDSIEGGKKVTISIKCKDVSIRTIKEGTDGGA